MKGGDFCQNGFFPIQTISAFHLGGGGVGGHIILNKTRGERPRPKFENVY